MKLMLHILLMILFIYY